MSGYCGFCLLFQFALAVDLVFVVYCVFPFIAVLGYCCLGVCLIVAGALVGLRFGVTVCCFGVVG